MKPLLALSFLALAVLSCSVTAPANSLSLTQRELPTHLVLSAVQETALPTLCVTADVLTLRTGPGVSFQPITWLTKGDKIIKLSSVGNWLEVTSSQYHGFVNSRFIGDCP